MTGWSRELGVRLLCEAQPGCREASISLSIYIYLGLNIEARTVLWCCWFKPGFIDVLVLLREAGSCSPYCCIASRTSIAVTAARLLLKVHRYSSCQAAAVPPGTAV